MKRYVLDANAIVSVPELLGSTSEKGAVVIPAATLREIESSPTLARGGRALRTLIDEAVARGVATTPDVDIVDSKSIPLASRMGFADAAVLAHALQLRAAGDEPVVVTRDRLMLRVSAELGIAVASPGQAVADLSLRATKTDPVLVQKASDAKQEGQRTLRLAVLVGAALGLGLALALEHIDWILARANTGLVIAGLVTVALALYWIRGRFRLGYGVTEFVFGLVSAWIGARIPLVAKQVSAVQVLQIVGGVYVMVRGLDNVGKGIATTRWQSHWESLFGKQ